MSAPQPSAIEERRRARRARQRRLVIWLSIACIVTLVAAIGTVGSLVFSALASSGSASADSGPTPTRTPESLVFPDDEPATAGGAEPCTAVTVMSSLENAEMVSNLAKGYNAKPRNIDGTCVVVTPERDKSGVVAEAAVAGFAGVPADKRPTVWMPDSHTWLSLARAGGAASVPAGGDSVATSNVVLAMPAPLAESIGWDAEPPTWTDVFDAAADANLWSNLGHPEWGAFKLGKTSPLVATSGEAAMFASFGTASGSIAHLKASSIEDPKIQATVQQHELSTSHYMATPEHFLWHARQAEATGSAADFLSAVIVDEKSVWDYNRGITSRDGITRIVADPPKEPLVPIYPTDGVFAADNPAVVLTGDWVDQHEADAAADFLRYAGTAQGQQIVRSSGYRDLNGELDPAVAETAKLAADPAGVLPLPQQDVVAAVNKTFSDVRKRANVLFLVDVSGSMDEPISASDTKLSAAKAAITQALGHFTTGDGVGLAAFAQDAGGTMLPGEVAPVADISTSQNAFLSALGGLHSMGDTPLYQAVDTFAAQQAKLSSPDKITAIVVLSDGKNDTNHDTIGADKMLADLTDLHHASPVLVFTLAYGADADVDTLQAISKATGAHYYDATDPTKLESVLGDLVTSF
ncbi:vWA domain-containing protein [Microbacterium deminutum]|uniref:Substrate-binding and VWA domain-containing protein n=1 Tax=Microbacterium deminutum TaxID=344164 RepID=A0ABP5C227_9MICO